jgi:hypothetical protein
MATLERLTHICCEAGVSYFSLPYFNGCERLQTLCKGGCLLEVSGVETLPVFKEMAGAGIGRILIKRAWELYSEWLKEVETITVEREETPPLLVKEEGKDAPSSAPLLPATKEEDCLIKIEEVTCS